MAHCSGDSGTVSTKTAQQWKSGTRVDTLKWQLWNDNLWECNRFSQTSFKSGYVRFDIVKLVKMWLL